MKQLPIWEVYTKKPRKRTSKREIKPQAMVNLNIKNENEEPEVYLHKPNCFMTIRKHITNAWKY